MSHFHPPEVVVRGTETQLQMGEKFIFLIKRSKGLCNADKQKLLLWSQSRFLQLSHKLKLWYT